MSLLSNCVKARLVLPSDEQTIKRESDIWAGRIFVVPATLSVLIFVRLNVDVPLVLAQHDRSSLEVVTVFRGRTLMRERQRNGNTHTHTNTLTHTQHRYKTKTKKK